MAAVRLAWRRSAGGAGAGARRPATPPKSSSVAADAAKFFGGAALALGMHESGHLVLDVAFDATRRSSASASGRFRFSPSRIVPACRRGANSRSRRRDSGCRSATSEWLFAKHPGSQARARAAREGDAGVQRARVGRLCGEPRSRKSGPFERDTRGMAASIGVDERGDRPARAGARRVRRVALFPPACALGGVGVEDREGGVGGARREVIAGHL